MYDDNDVARDRMILMIYTCNEFFFLEKQDGNGVIMSA